MAAVAAYIFSTVAANTFEFVAASTEGFLGVTGGLYAGAAVGVAAGVAAVGGTLYELNALLAPSTPSPAAQQQTFRQSLPPRYRGIGHTRMGGAKLLDYASGQNLRQVIAFADCILQNIDHRWLNQDEVTLSGNQVNTLANGAYSRVKLYETFGQTGVTAFGTLHSAYPAIWPTTCYGTGIFMGLVEASNGKIEDFTKDFPRGPQIQFNIAADVDVFYDWRDESQSKDDPSTWRPSANPVVGLVNELWRYRGYDWDACFAPTLSILTAEADVCDEAVPVLNVLSKVSVDTSGSPVRLRSVAGLSSGMTLYLAGQAVTVTGIGTTHTDGTDVSFSGGLGVPVAAGGLARWQSSVGSPATKPRYEAHGRWVSGEDESATIKRYLECMDGWLMRRGADGAFVIRAGHYVAPTVVLGLDEIVDYDWPGFVDLGKIVNERVPSYVEPANDYNQIDTTPWRNDDSVDADGLNSQPFAPGLVQSNSQVRRLAKAQSARDAAPVRNLVLKASGYRCIGERFLQLPAAGIEVEEMNGAIVEVAGDFKIVDNGMHVQIPVRLFDPACYSWSYRTEEGQGPADTAAPVGSQLSAPTITEVDPFFDDVAPGTVGVRLTISATGPSRDDLTWFYRWKVGGSTSWKESTDSSASGGSVELVTEFVPANASIDVEVAYSVGSGTPSPWSSASVVSTSTAAVAPSSPTLDVPTGGSGQAVVTGRNSTSANFDHLTIYRAAHGAGFGAAAAVVTLYGASGATFSYTNTGLSAGGYDYWIRAFNASGAPSAVVGPQTVTVT